MHASRYVVGIDLGTTNTVVSYADTQAALEGEAAVRDLPIPQTVAPGLVEARATLPSFLYLAAGPELSAGAMDLPWASERSFTVGHLARDQGSKVPARVVSSAKSWLCHAGVDRTAPLLPFQAPEEVPKISPLDASTRYLEHLRDAWNHGPGAEDPSARLEEQQVYLTVPASFDAVARELTVQAARQAGLAHVTLLEEPQAAFYAWLAHLGEAWRQQLGVGDRVLVCDVGGGTTDFTLISVVDRDGELSLERVAVGDHILLGGDNMDLALAHVASEKLAERGHAIDAWQTRSLWHACRAAKEQLFVDPSQEEVPVTVLGRGSKVIGGSLTTALSRQDLSRVLLDGFFPAVAADARPARGRRAGLQELGLPYATDAAITKHLAKFLGEHHGAGEGFTRPTAVLYNGGVMKAPTLKGRITEVLQSWVADQGAPLKELQGAHPDLAVSHGAAYYGLVRQGKGIRIRGGVGRSYYIGLESSMPAVPGLPAPIKALCVVPFGMEEGTDADVAGQELGMVVGEAVEFRFLSSTHRKDDGIGTVVERWSEGEIEELVPVQTAMADETATSGAMVPVRLHSRVTEVGTLALERRARAGRSWKL